MEEYQWIDGIIAVDAVLRAGSREVTAVLVNQRRYDGPTARLQQLAAAAGVPLSRVPVDEIDAQRPGVSHGGVIARVGPRRFTKLEELFAAPQPSIVLLDGVEDPHNFGQAVRSLYAAGIDGLIVPLRNWLDAAATVVRASAGASEFMPTAVSKTTGAIAAARSQGWTVAVATADDARPMDEVDLSAPLLLIIGGEKRGVARSAYEEDTVKVNIPYGRAVDYSLGTAAAASVLAFEIMRRRRSDS